MNSFNWIAYIDAITHNQPPPALPRQGGCSLSVAASCSYFFDSFPLGSFPLGSYFSGSFPLGSYFSGSFSVDSYLSGLYFFGSYGFSGSYRFSLSGSGEFQRFAPTADSPASESEPFGFAEFEPLNMFGYGIDLI